MSNNIDYRENNIWSVYIHTVPKEINGYEHDKYYVGITKAKVEYRWNHGNGYKRCTLFDRAIKKYGWENIYHEVIASHLTKSEAEQMEITLIGNLNTMNPNFGYNMLPGGEVNVKGIYDKQVDVYDLQGNFLFTCKSEREASYKTGISDSAISLCCNKKQKHAHEYIFTFRGDIPDLDLRQKNSYQVDQYTTDGQFVASYSYAREAEIKNNYPKCSIIRALSDSNNINNYTHGYIWIKHGDPLIEYQNPNNTRTLKLTIDNELVEKYESISECRRQNKITPKIMERLINKHHEYNGFKYAREVDVEPQPDGSFLLLKN